MGKAESTRILNVAHRGARAFAPENTLVAFAKAKALGCEMFEMDIRPSKDGNIVVFHDEDLLRCTDVKYRNPDLTSYAVSDFTYKELRELDAGSWYVEQLKLAPGKRQAFLQSLAGSEISDFVKQTELDYYASGKVKIPSLEEALSLAKDLDILVNIEIKGPATEGDGFVARLIQTIKFYSCENQILVTSFEHGWLRQIRQQTNMIMTGALTGNPIRAPVGYLRKLKANTYNLCRFESWKDINKNSRAYRQYLAHIKKIKTAGFDVYIWTCNDPEEMNALFASGITGIISDYPNRVHERLAYFIANQG